MSSAEPRLRAPGKLIFGLGDHTVNLVLSSLSLVFLFFLTDVAGLRPLLAGYVVWVARLVDAFTDPLMGRMSDRTTWKLGRRRPYFLIGALPFGLSFALLWQTPAEGQAEMFVYYTLVYVCLSLSTTVLSVPYLALIPEMATSYDERTSVNAYRAGAAIFGTIIAAGMLSLADGFGGGAQGFASAGLLLGVWIVLPWAAVYAASFERPQAAQPAQVPILQGMRSLARHPAYRRLSGLYISSRIALDISGAAFVYYVTYWIGRPEDVFPTLLSLFGVVVLSFPLVVRASRRFDKHRIFIAGGIWWVTLMFLLFTATPEWPRWLGFVLVGSIGLGYAACDLMPWAMLGEVIDEDELRTGQRRAGVYNGVFTFARKLAGATAILLAGWLLELSGYVADEPQPESALLAIRSLVALVPAAFLAIAIFVARGYPLGRTKHGEVVAELEMRREAGHL